MGQPARAEPLAACAVGFCDDHGFPHFGGLARVALGHATALNGQPEEGVTIIRAGLLHLAEIGSRLGTTHHLTLLADAQVVGGAFDSALDTTEECLQANSEEPTYRPETLRPRGEVHRTRNQIELAEADFLESLRCARAIGAKAWELRAATSLARLEHGRGARARARDLLTPLYSSFTEGFGTRDLIAARELLARIGS